uniref:Transposon Ty3-I Gag-Pol polyprotein n=1 Tax=Cajanus cajan TaxID=3821 RepID=A0A151QW05_CAJCA|nr:hypothetical protein KK1_044610 [Cajanus cajan]
MRITGYHKKKPLHVLIDSGSTHNFLDINIAKKLGCKIVELDPLNVVVADGTKLHISFVVKDFSWTIQQTTFTSDMMLIPLGCCDLVLGIEWLVTLGNITWNFDKLTMEFVVQGRRHVLREDTSLLQSMTTHATQPAIPQIILQLLDEFEDIFQEPTQLPPFRPNHDHKIPLIQGANSVNK